MNKLQFTEQNFQKGMIGLLIFAIPFVTFVFSLNLFDAFDLPKMATMYITAGSAILLWSIFASTSNEEYYLAHSKLSGALLFYMTAYTIALFVSKDSRLSFWGQYQSYAFGWLPQTCGVVIAILISQNCNQKFESVIVKTILYSSAISGLVALLQYKGISVFGLSAMQNSRVSGTFGNPIFLGTFQMIGFLLSLQQIFSELISNTNSGNSSSINKQENKKSIFGSAIITLFISIGLVLSFSRSAWLGSLCGFVVLLILYRNHYTVTKSSFILLTLLGVLFLTFAPFRERITTLFNKNSSDSVRIESWKITKQLIKKNFVFGTGPDTFLYSFRSERTPAFIQLQGQGFTQAHAHNDVLQMFVTGGILVAVAYILFWATLIFTSFTIPSKYLSAIFISLFVHNCFNFLSITNLFSLNVLIGIAIYQSKTSEITLSKSLRNQLAVFGVCISLFLFWCATRSVIADQYFFSHYEKISQGDYQGAVESLENAIRKNKGVPIYYETLTNIFKNLSTVDAYKNVRDAFLNNAYVTANQAKNMIPMNPDTYNNLGVVLMWIDQFLKIDKKSEAEKEFQAAINLDPNFIDAWCNLAKVSHFKGQVSDEIRSWEKALSIDPKREDIIQILKVLNTQKNLVTEKQATAN